MTTWHLAFGICCSQSSRHLEGPEGRRSDRRWHEKKEKEKERKPLYQGNEGEIMQIYVCVFFARESSAKG